MEPNKKRPKNKPPLFAIIFNFAIHPHNVPNLFIFGL